MKPTIGERYQTLSIFGRMLWIGLVITMIGIICEQWKNIPPSQLQYIFSIFYELLKNIGIAVIITHIFNFIIGTPRFLDYIRDKIISVVISKDFINRLSIDDRRSMLEEILKPSKSLSDIYSGINTYFHRYINNSLELFKTHFRSSYTITGIAKYDSTKSKIKLQLTLNYRIYKVMGKYERLPIGFEDAESEHCETVIYTPSGEEYKIDVETFQSGKAKTLEHVDVKEKDSFIEKDSSIVKGSYAKIPDKLMEYDQLDVIRKVNEYGQDHWHLFTYRATKPCDKLIIDIKCEDGIIVRKCIPFGNIESFKIEQERDCIILPKNWAHD